MTKGELKKIIKETVKDCIREVLMENEIFSSIIKEVIVSTKNTVLESNNRISMQPTPNIKNTAPEFDNRISMQSIPNRKNIYNEAGAGLRNRDQHTIETEDNYEPRKNHEVLSNQEVLREIDDVSTVSKYSNGSDAVQYMNELAEQSNTVPLDTLKSLFGMN